MDPKTRDEKIFKLGKIITDRKEILLGLEKMSTDSPEYWGTDCGLQYAERRYGKEIADDCQSMDIEHLSHWLKKYDGQIGVCNALRTSQLFNTPNMSRSAYTSDVDPENCVACGKCVEVCPAGAVRLGQKLCTSHGEIEYPKAELRTQRGGYEQVPGLRHVHRPVQARRDPPLPHERRRILEDDPGRHLVRRLQKDLSHREIRKDLPPLRQRQHMA